jgi:hypothetical protein
MPTRAIILRYRNVLFRGGKLFSKSQKTLARLTGVRSRHLTCGLDPVGSGYRVTGTPPARIFSSALEMGDNGSFK